MHNVDADAGIGMMSADMYINKQDKTICSEK